MSVIPSATQLFNDNRQTSNIRRILVGNDIDDHSDEWSWCIAYRRCTNCIFIIDLTPGFRELIALNLPVW